MKHQRKPRFLYSIMSVINALIILVAGAGIAFAGYKTMHQLPIRSYFPEVRTNAIWEWRNLNSIVDDSVATADFLNQHQINTVYLDVSSDAVRSNYVDLQKYIGVMRANKVRVFAMGGDKEWSKPAKRGPTKDLVNYVFDYNRNYPNAKFSGIEFDIESYNQDGFVNAGMMEKSIILSEYLDTVDVIAAQFTDKLKAQPDKDMELGFAVPYWFDNQNDNIKSITWKEKTGPVIYHVLDRLNTVQKSNVVVMSYRNASRGNNGTIALSRTEIQYAQYKAPNVKVIIGQETTKVEPEKITFYGKTKTELSQEVKWIDDQFNSIPTYGGIALNDMKGYSELAD